MTDTVAWCRRESMRVSEPLHATAAQVDLWLGLEVRGPWSARPLAECGIEREVLEWLDQVPGGRLQLLRRPGRTGSRRLLVANRHFTARLDWASAADLPPSPARLVEAVNPPPSFRPVHQRVYLVCTHGQRDRCCAKWGAAMYRALAQRAPQRVWQTSHLGGHRFAATLVELRSGHVYGRLEADEADALFEAAEAGRLHALHRVRGCSFVRRPEQAAELAVRERMAAFAFDDVRSVGMQQTGDRRWSVTVQVRGSHETIEVVARELPGVVGSCGDDPVTRLAYRAVSAHGVAASSRSAH